MSERVDQIMSAPIVTCQADVPLDEVAELMAGHRIHAVVVVGEQRGGADEARPWRVISDHDLVRAVNLGPEPTTAGRIAASPLVTIDRAEPVHQAAMLMSDHEVTHVIVVDRGHPVGIVSALDVAASVAAASAPTPAPEAEPAPEGVGLRAMPGDRLIIRGHHLGEVGRDAEILEPRGPGGGPPFLVRWEDNGHVTLLYPGSDASVEHLSRPTG